MPEDIQRLVDQVEGGRPWWQACCLGCGIFLFAVVAMVFWFFHLLRGPDIQDLRALPANVPSDIKIVRLKEAKSIQYIPAAQKLGTLERILSPFQVLGILTSSTAAVLSTQTIEQTRAMHMDTVTMEWGPMPDFRYTDAVKQYKALLEQGNFRIESMRDDAAHVDIIFGERPDMNIQVDVKGSSKNTGIDEIRIVMNYVVQ